MDVKKFGSSSRKNHILRFGSGLFHCLLLNLPSRKWETRFIMKFLSSEVALYLYKSTIRPSMDYCHVGVGALSCYWDMFENFQKRVCRSNTCCLSRTLGSLSKCAQFNPLSTNFTKWSNTLKQFVGCCRRIVWVCLTTLWDWCFKGYVFCYRYYFGRYLSELAEQNPLPFSRGRSTRCCDRLHDFPVTFLDFIRMSLSTVSLLLQLDRGILSLWTAFIWPLI